MTAEELASLLLSEQGFFVAPSYRKREVGEIVRTATLEGKHLCPVRVVGTATFKEMKSQRSRQCELTGDKTGMPWHPGPYYYRVVAAD